MHRDTLRPPVELGCAHLAPAAPLTWYAAASVAPSAAAKAACRGRIAASSSPATLLPSSKRTVAARARSSGVA
jgi:hypothetical protein